MNRGIKWETDYGSHKTTMYINLDHIHSIAIGTEEIEGPEILLDRKRYFYFHVTTGAAEGGYSVIVGFDGPLRFYRADEEFRFGIDTFTLL